MTTGSTSAVPPGNCGIHGYHGRTQCPKCSTSALPFTPLISQPSPSEPVREAELMPTTYWRAIYIVGPRLSQFTNFRTGVWQLFWGTDIFFGPVPVLKAIVVFQIVLACVFRWTL